MDTYCEVRQAWMPYDKMHNIGKEKNLYCPTPLKSSSLHKMFDMCKPKTTFWDAVRDNKLDTLMPLIPKHKGSTDHRPTKPDDNIF